MLAIKNKKCILQLLNKPTNFRITIINSYLYEFLNIYILILHILNVLKLNQLKQANQIIYNDNKNNNDKVKLSY